MKKCLVLISLLGLSSISYANPQMRVIDVGSSQNGCHPLGGANVNAYASGNTIVMNGFIASVEKTGCLVIANVKLNGNWRIGFGRLDVETSFDINEGSVRISGSSQVGRSTVRDGYSASFTSADNGNRYHNISTGGSRFGRCSDTHEITYTFTVDGRRANRNAIGELHGAKSQLIFERC